MRFQRPAWQCSTLRSEPCPCMTLACLCPTSVEQNAALDFQMLPSTAGPGPAPPQRLHCRPSQLGLTCPPGAEAAEATGASRHLVSLKQ